MKSLLKCFVYSGIIIFERLNSRTEHNFVSALYQGTLNQSLSSLHKIPSCTTLHEACSLIQKTSTLHELNDALIAIVKSYYLSNSCQDVCDGFSSTTEHVFIFKSSSTRQLTAYPILPVSEDETNIEQCSTCGYHSTINVNMHVHKQSFIECPPCLIVRILLI
jgi:hypothetical protein